MEPGEVNTLGALLRVANNFVFRRLVVDDLERFPRTVAGLRHSLQHPFDCGDFQSPGMVLAFRVP